MTVLDIRGATLSAADPPIATNPNPDLAWKAPVRVATTGGNITLSGLQTVDGVSLAAGDRVLVKDQTDQTTNGLYNAATSAWTRTIDTQDNSRWARGVQVAVTDGTANIGTNWKCAASSPITLGASAITFVQSVTLATDTLWLSIEAFGGIDDDSTDNTTALNNALAALPGRGGGIFFPVKIGKQYKFLSAITFNFPGSSAVFSLTLMGAGADATTLTWPNASGGMQFNLSSAQHSLHVRNLSLTTGHAGGGTALGISNSVSLGNNPTSDISDVAICGEDRTGLTSYWTTAVNLSEVSCNNIDSLTVFGDSTGTHGTGVNMTGGSGFSIVTNIQRSNFFFVGTGIAVGANVQGITVEASNFTNGTTGISGAASVSGQTQLAVTNSQFNVLGDAIVTNSAFGDIIIDDDLFIVASGHNGVNAAESDTLIVSGSSFSGVTANVGTGITVGATTGETNTITGNAFFLLATGAAIGGNNVAVTGNGFASNTTGLAITGNSVLAIGNTFVVNSTHLTNSGTGNVVVNNPGYNPVGSSNVSVGASPFTYTAGASPETLYYRNNNAAGSALTIVLNNGGQTICSNSPGSGVPVTLDLGPNESATFTDGASIRVLIKMVH